MNRPLVVRPISDLTDNARMPEAGRIRLGIKGGKGQPQVLDRIRFTSVYEDLIRDLAVIYGGEARPWHDGLANPPDQWEVITTSPRVRVVLPPNCLQQDYEMWTRGGCVRRCDGIECNTSQDGPHGSEPVQVPCMCAAEGKLACKTKTRVSMILPDVTMRGVWRLDTSSDYAAIEMNGMIQVIHSVAHVRFPVAELGLSARRVTRNGETKRFTVPVLTLLGTPEELAAGGQQLRGISPAGHHPELPALPAPADPFPHDDDVIDAEVIDDEDLTPLQARCWAQADRFIVDAQALWAGMLAQVDGDLSRVEKGIAKMETDELVPIGFVDGLVQWDDRSTHQPQENRDE